MSVSEAKCAALDRITNRGQWFARGKATYRVGLQVVHVRFCSTDRVRSSHYKSNVNPATLRSHHEVWICGDADTYYLLPLSVVQKIYDDPRTYIDRRHPKIRVLSVDTERHEAVYGAGGLRLDLKPFFQGIL
jgi:hypothetical protein